MNCHSVHPLRFFEHSKKWKIRVKECVLGNKQKNAAVYAIKATTK